MKMPKQIKALIGLAVGLYVLVLPGFATASTGILSVGNVVTASSNLGVAATVTTSGPTVNTYNNSATQDYQSNTVTTLTSAVQTQPTDTTAGLQYNYKTDTTTTTWNDILWKNDYLSITVDSTGTNQAGGKWISLTGSVVSAVDTALYFNLGASGNFTPAFTPFGTAAPLLASFYFGNTAVAPVPNSYTGANLDSLTYSAQASSYSSSYNSTVFNLSAGVQESFAAIVYASSDVSINVFNLNASTSNFDVRSIPHSTTSATTSLLGASVISPTPEPEQLAMLLTGLTLVGAVTRRRAQKKAAALAG
jgi:hypothetical protein